MAHHAITMLDGSVAIMQVFGDATPEQCLAKWHPTERAKVVSHRPVSPGIIPQDRTFRDAWIDTGAAIEHDMDKARDIQRERLRAVRAPMLAALDTAYLQADEIGDAKGKSDIAAQKQTLRDATDHPAIDDATTVEELKAVTISAVLTADEKASVGPSPKA